MACSGHQYGQRCGPTCLSTTQHELVIEAWRLYLAVLAEGREERRG